MIVSRGKRTPLYSNFCHIIQLCSLKSPFLINFLEIKISYLDSVGRKLTSDGALLNNVTKILKSQSKIEVQKKYIVMHVKLS